MRLSAGRVRLGLRLGLRLGFRIGLRLSAPPVSRRLSNPSSRAVSSDRPSTDARVFMAAKYESWTRTGLIRRLRTLEAELQTPQEDAPLTELRRAKKAKGRRMDRSRYSTRYIALKLAYLGKRYGGFEFQAMTNQPTIEEELWNALTRACLVFPDSEEEEVVQFDCCEYSKCGRTDRGVSAFGQVVGLRVRSNRPLPRRREEEEEEEEEKEQEETPPPFDDVADELCYPRILNRILPRDIRVLAWCPSPPDGFSARFSCRERQYRYFFTQPAFAPPPPPHLAPPGTVSPGWLDVAAMRDAAKRFEGEQDFRNLCKVDPSKQITNFRRRVFEADIVEVHNVGSALPYLQDSGCVHAGDGSHHPKVYYFLVRGSAFLWHQIRHMVAILFLVGQGLEKPSVVSQLLDVEAHPRKPTYVMADEVPLVLWDCVFPDADANATDKLEDSLRWIYVGDEQVGDKFGPFGVVDGMWRLWRECKMDELLAHQLLQQVASRGPTTRCGGGDDNEVDDNKSVALFEGGNGKRLGGKYVPVMEKSLTLSPDEQNDKYAKRKGYASAEDMRAQKAMGRGREAEKTADDE